MAGSRRRLRWSSEATYTVQPSGITAATWANMATVDAHLILKQNIIALDKCSSHYRNLWRFAVSEVNQAGHSLHPVACKGTEITLALLPNMLLRTPSAEICLMSARQKMDQTFQILCRGFCNVG